MSPAEPDGVGAVTAPPAPPGPAAAPAPPAVAPWRLLATLGVGGVVAGLCLVVAYGLTLPRIEANRAAALARAVNQVLKAPARYETLYLVDGRLTKVAPPGANPKKLEQVYLGYGAEGQRRGFALVGGEPGFQDVILLIFGYDPATRQLLGMTVLESKETPGLGDKIEKDAAFVAQFDGVGSPLVGVPKGKKAGPRDVATITGATISSRAVIRIINNTLKRVGPAVEAYAAEGGG